MEKKEKKLEKNRRYKPRNLKTKENNKYPCGN